MQDKFKTLLPNNTYKLRSIIFSQQIFVAGVLDAELNSGINNYIITVKATDSGSLTCTGTIQIDIGDVNEFAPVFAETFESATVTEGASVDTRY